MRKSVVAMSGGVDSSVAAALMVERGFETVGVTLKLLPGEPTGFGCCGSPADVEDAKKVCARLGIAHYVVSLDDLFEDSVIAPFVSAYLKGETPNPCVSCNRFVKFGHLLGLARSWNADCLATGHYARIKAGRLHRAADSSKDQSYFLYMLGFRELERLCFPVGELSKPEVRSQARRLGLATADKPESQEICFVPNRDYRRFVKSRVPAEESAAAVAPGPIKDRSGRVLGRHDGVINYTVGQRKGLGLGGGTSRYVLSLDSERRTVVVGSRSEGFSRVFEVSGMIWSGGSPPESRDAEIRIRHRHEPALANFDILEGDRARVEFREPQRAVAPGQAAVFYRGSEVLGGGTISGVIE